jgi:hypothetical protein
MEKLLSYIIVAIIALVAVAISYRVNFLHSLVYGKGSARVNKLADAAVSTPKVVTQ